MPVVVALATVKSGCLLVAFTGPLYSMGAANHNMRGSLVLMTGSAIILVVAET